MLKALQSRVERVTAIGGIKPRRTPVDSLLRLVLGGRPPRYPLWMTHASLRNDAREVEKLIRAENPDAVLSISSQCLVYLRTSVPTYMFNDAPWMTFKEIYSEWEPMPLSGERFARQEADAAKRCRALFTASAWSADEAAKLYGVPREWIFEAPLGANWVPGVGSGELIEIARERTKPGALQLLFIGKDWERKGGPLAVETAMILHRRGHNVRLHVVGCSPELPAGADACVTVHGVLNLGNDEHRRRLEAMFLASHLFLVPTRAECFGIVFAEAQAFAVPPVSRRVNGLESIVVDGVTGALLAADAPAGDYADRIEEMVSDREGYVRMAAAARARFETQLTWEYQADVIVRGIEATM
jgi:glycosyltransferase involved in cell wall biosynthesis